MGLGGVSPWAFRHRSLLKTRLGSTLWRNSQSCLAGPSNPPENKMAAVGSTKRLPWSHNDILRLVKAPPLSSSVLPSRQQYRMWDYPGTPPPSVYQVTHGTALQAERHVMHLVMVLPSRQQVVCADYLAHFHRRSTRLLMALSSGVLPSRQLYPIGVYPGTPPPSVYQVTHGTALQAAGCLRYICPIRMGSQITTSPQALRCLEGTTMSNRGQRPRIRTQ